MHTDGPVRTCAACRTRRSQGVLMRVARGANGIAKVDHGQKRAPGRGAYLCRAVSCVELAAKRQALRRALGAEVPANIYVELMSLTAQTDIEAE